ncbi:ABC transporter ATP-binding protein [Roseicitreum antarcticum]|uniref:Lactose/L-arabinose transport system ATP-binding protein n=1 Tax=Roseicitreum antarcticum TaxID=564137 RepID=A0A1H2ZAD6_9RHOB|nr:ABC transporter ATP-binding protein [Roseicitreum antarcticum]SDX13749.1 lactose/L-arabinose transport system ATP-binding protein [Roseicitreum antarcticum]
MSGVSLRKVVKRYGALQVIHDIDIDVAAGEVCVFVGPQGCCKSTLMRMIAGLEKTSGGVICIGAQDVTALDAAQRGVVMAYPTDELVPHLTVAENIALGLKAVDVRAGDAAGCVADTARFLKLDDCLHMKVRKLPEDQRQRTALGRAIVRRAPVLLLDEPLSVQDARLRAALREALVQRLRDTGTTLIYGTHDPAEAMRLADRIVVLRAGRVEQAGAPQDLCHDPDTLFVAEFLASPALNVLTARADDGMLTLPGLGTAPLPRHLFAHNGTTVAVGLRPQHLALVPGDSHRVTGRDVVGDGTHLTLTGGGERALTVVTAQSATALPQVGARTGIRFRYQDMLLFDPVSSRRLR